MSEVAETIVVTDAEPVTLPYSYARRSGVVLRPGPARSGVVLS